MDTALDMLIIAIRGPSGIVTWTRKPRGVASYDWVCGRDGFRVGQPKTPAATEQTLGTIVSHSANIVGTVSTVVELDL